MESVAARKPNGKTSSFAFPKVLSKVLKLDFWCFRMPYGATGAPKISKLQLVGVMAWKRSSVRSRSGPPIISII